MSSNRSSLRIARIVLVFFLSSAIASAQQPGTLLSSKPIASFDETANTISDLLARLAYAYQVPIGVEVVERSTGSAKELSIRIPVKSGTVRDVLEATVKAQPSYTWQEVDGVINVVPRQHVDSVLDVVIAKFEIKELGKYEALRKLTSTPEVQSWLARTGLRERSLTGGVLSTSPATSDGAKWISLNMTNTNVRTILNQIMKTSGAYEWVYFRYGPDNRFFSLAM
jgi:hypothetical protein